MKKEWFIFSIIILLLISCRRVDTNENASSSIFTNISSPERMLLVLSAPSVYEPYYEPAFESIVQFQIQYAKAIMGHDNVVVITDQYTLPYYSGLLPDDVLLTADVYDIWMRDFTTVNPLHPVQFRYTWASMLQQESEEVQASFSTMADQYGIERSLSSYFLDGGNIVDNYAGKVITTERFLDDNNLEYEEGKQVLMTLLNASEVAILRPDDEVLAHADGMVMWGGGDTLFVNDYSAYPSFRDSIITELQNSFPSTSIIEVPVEYAESTPGAWEGFSSACGIHLNATVTFQNIYIPLFGMPLDDVLPALISANTNKNIITVPAEGVCPMGGSVRCLTWQLSGKNADRMIQAARVY